MPKAKINFAAAFMSRNGAVEGKDTYIKNAYIEKYDQKLYVVKRPGTAQFTNLNVTGQPQGAFFFNGSSYVIINDTLYVTSSGQNTGTNGSAFTSPSVPVWYGKRSFGAAVFQNRIYVIGGQGAFQYADVNYTPDGLNWSVNSSAGPFGSLAYPSVCVFNNKLWVMGGVNQNTGTVNNSVWSSDNGTDFTQVAASVPWGGRFDARVVVGNGGMYIIGGETFPGFVPLGDVWFSNDGITWNQIQANAPWLPRHQHQALYFQNKLWVIGGVNAGGVALNDVWSSPDGVNWIQVTSMAFASGRFDMAVVVYNNKMWIIGGQLVPAAWVADVYSSPDGMTWTLVTTTPGFSGRSQAQAVVFSAPPTINQYKYPTIYLLGGTHDGTTSLQEVWMGNINSPLQATYALNPTVTGQMYQFATFVNGVYLLIKNQSNLWVLSAGTLILVTDTDYPAVTVPGIVVLGNYAYVMNPQGVIQACAYNDATTWPATQFIQANYENDPAIVLVKFLNYVTAMKQYTTQFFYDNANPAPGIPLSAYTNANVRIGCQIAGSVQNIENTLIWVGQSSNRGWGVYILNGMNPDKVSPSWVDRVINNLQTGFLSSLVTSIDGHLFYMLNFSSHDALVFDVKFGVWFWWTGTGSSFPYMLSYTDFVQSYWVGLNNGIIYSVSNQVYGDNNVAFPMVTQTDKIDNGTLERKFWGRLDFVADINNSNVLIEYTDDDYNTYLRWGLINLNQIRPYINRGGSSRRRAIRATQTDLNPARWEAMELTFSQGES